jgi:hypothetical protein
MKSLALAAVATLSLASGAAHATPSAEIDLTSTASSNEAVATIGYRWFVYTRTYGRCVFRYAYVTNGYRYAYAWRRVCGNSLLSRKSG